ncbi:MAG: tyrosine--tRNA ligase [Gemmatimonadota bacterium]|nr:tyrosine--tRNA ligase [Gemmatimonadota bacterium]
MMNLYDALAERGMVQDATPAAAERLRAGPITGYIGFDPTADSLHVGNLVPVMALAWLQRTGGTPVVLLGGGTAMVGDPSGKRSERPVLAVETIDANAARLRDQFARVLRFDGPAGARLLDNAEWLRSVPLMDFLRDTGKHFTVNYMLQKESVRSRMESGISFTEFAYMLVQAHDFWHLWTTGHVELQMGGSDQWGNITAGIELISRREGATAHGLVLPLLTTATGAKFGKSEAGNVWLDPVKTPPTTFYDFWLNTDDRDVERFLKIFTFLEIGDIAGVMREHAADPGARTAHRRLAWEVTALVHGGETADEVVATKQALFGARGGGAAVELDALLVAVPESNRARVSRAELDTGLSLVDALVRTGLASSKADARRGIQGKGFYVGDEQVSEVDRRLGIGDVRDGSHVLLRKGKKSYGVLVVED